MIKVHISGNRADVIEREPLTSGTVGKVINFVFTEDWRLLIKYAVFEGSGRRIALTNIGDSCIIPHEVLAKHGGALRVGVYGRTADGSAATPTVYAQLGIIQRGADPNADPSTKPTLPVWAQLQAQIGDLSNLTTEDKTSLVAAINEAAKSGGGSGGKDGTGIESITYKGEDEFGGNVYTVLLTDGTSYDITAPKGADGAAGADGVTPHIGDNGNWYLGTTDTGKPSRGETGLQGPVGPQGPQGEKGEDAATDLTLGLTGATVGQIAKIAAVDASGVPTAWSPVDMPSGGETWELINEVTLSEDAMAVAFDKDKSGAAFALRKFAVFGWTKGSNASNTNGGAICINAANTADDNYSIVPPFSPHGALKGDQNRFWHAAAESFAETGWRWYLTGADNTWRTNQVIIGTSLRLVSQTVPKVATYLALWSRTSGAAFAAGSKIELYGVRA